MTFLLPCQIKVFMLTSIYWKRGLCAVIHLERKHSLVSRWSLSSWYFFYWLKTIQYLSTIQFQIDWNILIWSEESEYDKVHLQLLSLEQTFILTRRNANPFGFIVLTALRYFFYKRLTQFRQCSHGNKIPSVKFVSVFLVYCPYTMQWYRHTISREFLSI